MAYPCDTFLRRKRPGIDAPDGLSSPPLPGHLPHEQMVVSVPDFQHQKATSDPGAVCYQNTVTAALKDDLRIGAGQSAARWYFAVIATEIAVEHPSSARTVPARSRLHVRNVLLPGSVTRQTALWQGACDFRPAGRPDFADHP